MNKNSGKPTESYWKRIEYEEGLLNTRTNVVLVLNGLAAVAVGLGTRVNIAVVAVAILIINGFWIYLAGKSFQTEIDLGIQDNHYE